MNSGRGSRHLLWSILAALAGIIHASISAYWAAGGSWLLDTVDPKLVESIKETAWILWFVAALKLLAAILPLFAEIRGGWLRSIIRIVSWIGAIGIIVWGGWNSARANLILLGIIERNPSATDSSLIGYAFLWDPLFLFWGIFLLIGLVRTRGKVYTHG